MDGKRVIDGRPATLKQTCEESLKNLQTEVIDLYYLHRWDKRVPIEESIGALADLVRAGKVKDHRPVGGIGRDTAQGACGAPDHGVAD